MVQIIPDLYKSLIKFIREEKMCSDLTICDTEMLSLCFSTFIDILRINLHMTIHYLKTKLTFFFDKFQEEGQRLVLVWVHWVSRRHKVLHT